MVCLFISVKHSVIYHQGKNLLYIYFYGFFIIEEHLSFINSFYHLHFNKKRKIGEQTLICGFTLALLAGTDSHTYTNHINTYTTTYMPNRYTQIMHIALSPQPYHSTHILYTHNATNRHTHTLKQYVNHFLKPSILKQNDAFISFKTFKYK